MAITRRDFLVRCGLGCGGVAWLSAARGHAAPAVARTDEPGYLALERSGELARREQALREIYEQRACCPRRCDKNRKPHEPPVCAYSQRLKVASAGPHFGEEPPLTGRRGSGTIFFSHCNLLCDYCQNWELAHRGDGQFIEPDALADVMIAIQERGCHNINLVTPSHVVQHVVRALRLAIPMGLRLPLVYNTGGYDRIEVIRLLAGVVDIYLPDFKYQDPKAAERYSLGAADYPQVAAAAIAEMYRQVGRLRLDQNGIARRGLMIRHLVLPGNIAGTDRFVRWVASELSPDCYVNLMDQYRPAFRALQEPELNRRITSQEWRQALAWARQAGLTRLEL